MTTEVRSDGVVTIVSVQTVSSDEWRAAVVLRGEFDAANACELRTELSHHLDAGRRVIRVDVHEVTFMDSTAVGAIVDATERCRAAHGSLILTRVPGRMRRLLAVAGLDEVLLVDTAGNQVVESASSA